MKKILKAFSGRSEGSYRAVLSFGYFFVILGILLGIFINVRYGAISLGLGVAIKSALGIRENWRRRPIEVVIPLAIAVALITIAILLPRSSA